MITLIIGFVAGFVTSFFVFRNSSKLTSKANDVVADAKKL